MRGGFKMACMEHGCGNCGHWWFDNTVSGPCPSCGSTIVTGTFDEDYHEGNENE